MAKAMNDYALGAKMIRQWLKAEGIVGRVTSEGYSMGSSINVYVQDQVPEVYAKVKEYAGKFQYGHFNGMEDIYEYSNCNDKLPQAKFVFVNNEISDEMRQKIWDFALGYYSDMEGAPADVKQAYNFRLVNWGMWGDQLVYRLFAGGFNQNEFWNFVAAQQAKVA